MCMMVYTISYDRKIKTNDWSRRLEGLLLFHFVDSNIHVSKVHVSYNTCRYNRKIPTVCVRWHSMGNMNKRIQVVATFEFDRMSLDKWQQPQSGITRTVRCTAFNVFRIVLDCIGLFHEYYDYNMIMIHISRIFKIQWQEQMFRVRRNHSNSWVINARNYSDQKWGHENYLIQYILFNII